MALIKCSECGKKISSNADKCPNCGQPNMVLKKQNERNDSLSNIKLILGLISVAIFILIGFRSCTIGLATTTYTDEIYNGFVCAFLTLIGGIVLISTRKSKKIFGLIIGALIYLISFATTIGTGVTRFKDLPILGLIPLLFAIINVVLIIIQKSKIK